MHKSTAAPTVRTMRAQEYEESRRDVSAAWGQEHVNPKESVVSPVRGPAQSRTMKRFAVAAPLCISMLLAAGPARAGHAATHIPSFYPHKIAIETIDPVSAATQLEKNALHAYIGSVPHFAGNIPETLKAVKSLDAFLVLTFNPASEKFKQAARRCAVVNHILTALAQQPASIVVHPYPITPYHADYLQHLDRIEQAKAKVGAEATINPALKFRTKGGRAQALVQSRWQLDHDNWDVGLEEVPVSRLMSSSGAPSNGWLDPPWIKEGWFHAYRLLAPAIGDPQQKWIARMFYRRLTGGDYADLREQLDIERRLVASLTRNCDRAVIGYTVRQEYYNASFSGVENITFDSQLGLNSPVFIRTVKLKDFPWNGRLQLGTKEKPEAAWNPIAGFTDPWGRLVWSTLGDAALLPLPYNDSWIPNRTIPDTAGKARSKDFKVPPVAMIPQPGTGVLQAVGRGKVSTAKIVYRVLASLFHDGTDMEIADLLYPYVFAYRWGVKFGTNDRAYDPAIEAATVLIRERLMGVRVLRVEQTIKQITADIKVRQQTPVVEVYVNHVAPDPRQTAALAPPWSTVPWHVLVLMEEAVQRGLAAFSKEEAERRGVGWLDLARDRSMHARLSKLIDGFERDGYRPAVLKDRVSAEAARLRWRALKKFSEEHGHFLVTNGPYRLTKWSENSSVLEVVRELTYPHGVGSFNHYAYPPRAVITNVKRDANRVLVYVDVERVVQEQRSYVNVRERLKRVAMRGLYLIRPDSRYLVLGPDGSVVKASTASMKDDGRFVAELPQSLPRGRYTFLVAIYLDGNSVRPPARSFSFEVAGS